MSSIKKYWDPWDSSQMWVSILVCFLLSQRAQRARSCIVCCGTAIFVYLKFMWIAELNVAANLIPPTEQWSLTWQELHYKCKSNVFYNIHAHTRWIPATKVPRKYIVFCSFLFLCFCSFVPLSHPQTYTPADQICWVRSLPLRRLDCWCSSSSGGTGVRSCAAPLRHTGPPAGQHGHGGFLGTGGPSGPPGCHQGRERDIFFSQHHVIPLN